MSAVAGRACWVLAQRTVADQSNAITAIPDRLVLLDLNGAVASLAAMGYQKAIVSHLGAVNRFTRWISEIPQFVFRGRMIKNGFRRLALLDTLLILREHNLIPILDRLNDFPGYPQRNASPL